MSSRDRSFKPGLAGILLLGLSCSTALAADQDVVAAPARGAYVGLFGGGGVASIGTVTQFGTVFFVEAAGGPLSVNATGQSNSSGVGLAGLHIGHEWSYGSSLLPAVEIEGFYLAGTQHARLNNPSSRLPEQTFNNTFPMDNAVLLANVVLGFRTSYQNITPYVGGGIGAARVSIHGADSAQINPPEFGINHFNSASDSSAWGFAAQAKAGVRIALGNNAYVFGEYRYLFVDTNNQTFGPTVYPTHAPTTAWTVRFDDMSHHLAVGGIGFKF
jgi:opacity protein-like surface antigen